MAHVTIIGTVPAKPETLDELLALLTAQLAPTRAEPGCLNYEFHVDAADLDAHLAMPHLKPLFLQLDRLLARPVDVRHLKMLSNMVGQK
jgi:quinol monooxygenase YgiN